MRIFGVRRASWKSKRVKVDIRGADAAQWRKAIVFVSFVCAPEPGPFFSSGSFVAKISEMAAGVI